MASRVLSGDPAYQGFLDGAAQRDLRDNAGGVTQAVDYFRWLASEAPDTSLTAEQVGMFLYLSVIEGRYHTDITDILGLPERDE